MPNTKLRQRIDLSDCSFNRSARAVRLRSVIGQKLNGAKLSVINAPQSSAINSAKGFGRLRNLSGIDVICLVKKIPPVGGIVVDITLVNLVVKYCQSQQVNLAIISVEYTKLHIVHLHNFIAFW